MLNFIVQEDILINFLFKNVIAVGFYYLCQDATGFCKQSEI
jgi:hypothetical protein